LCIRKKEVFTSDRTTLTTGPTSVEITYSLAVMDLTTKAITNIDVFHGANNLNPQFSASGQQIYFLSNRDGFRNLSSVSWVIFLLLVLKR